MKKIFVFVLIFAVLFSSCGKEKPEDIINKEEFLVSEQEKEKNPSVSEQERNDNNEKDTYEDISINYINVESGKLSGMLHPLVDTEKDSEICKNEIVSVSMSVQEGWKQGTFEEEGEIYGITFKLPWDNYHYASIAVYKDTGTTYEDFLANNSLWVGINEHTYHEVSGNFLKGSYIRFDYPTSEKYDVEEDAVPVYGRFYQIQFDGYVADVRVYIRIDSEENTDFDEKICDEFISSIKIG